MTEALLPADRLRALVDGAAAVASQTELTALLNTAVTTAMDLTSAQYGALGVIGAHGTLVEFLHAGMDPKTVALIGAPPTGHGVLGTITRMATTVRIEHIADHPDSVGFPEHHPPMESFLGVPVRAGDEVFGNLYLTDKVGAFTPDDEAVVEALAVIAGAAIRTSRLQRRMRRVAVVEDRERIARDLHDAIIQDLFAVGLTLQAQSQKLADEPIRGAIEDAVTRLDDAISSLRRFVFDLDPPVWLRRDLQGELTELVSRIAGAHDVAAQVAFVGDLRDIPPSLVEDVIHAVRESVSNAVRHSGTDVVDVTVRRTTSDLSVTVADRGSGFDPETTARGLGLDNLETRAAKAGGEAAITSGADAGTTVQITFPL